MAKLDYDELNSTIRYLMFSVFAVEQGALPEDRAAVIDETATFLKQQEDKGVVVRGIYDVAGLRADADLMLWLHGDRPEDLQAEARRLRRSAELAPLVPVWNVMGVHRPAEFSADHLPAYMRDTQPREWLTVYPFVRSYEWYLLPADERRAMLGEHGRKGRAYASVLSNTVASFALGDYEWLLGLEADDLTDLVDLMRALRETGARRHVREEVPFFTGRRIDVDEVPGVVL